MWAAFPSSLPQGHFHHLAVLSGVLQGPLEMAGSHQWPECLTNLSPLVSPPTGLLGVLLQPSLPEPDRRAVPELRQCHHQADLQQQLGTGEILPRSAFHLGTGQPQGSSTAHPLLWSAVESQEKHKGLCTWREMGEKPATPWGLLPLPVFAPSCTEGLFPSVGTSSTVCVQPPPVLPPLQLQELFPTASRTQLRDACTASSYTLTLLLQGYKFNSTTWPNIHFVQQVGECPAAPSFHTWCHEVPFAHPAGTEGTRAAQPHCPYPGQLLSYTHAAAGTSGLALSALPQFMSLLGPLQPKVGTEMVVVKQDLGVQAPL